MASYVLYAVGYKYVFLVLGAILAGIGRAFYSGNNDALLYDTLREHKKEGKFDHYLGKVNSSEHIALAVSALLGGIVAHFSFSLAMWLSVIPQIINVIISFGFYEPKVYSKKVETNLYTHFFDAAKHFMKNKSLMILTIAGVVSFGVGEAIFQFRAAFVEQLWPIWAIGLLSVISNIGASWSFYYSSSLINKFGSKVIIVGGKVFSRLAQIIAFGFPSVFSPLILTIPSLIHGVGWTARTNFFQKEFTNHQRATMDSIKSLFNNLGFGIVSLAIGFTVDRIGPSKTMLYAQFLLILPILMYLKFFRMKQE